MTPSKKKLIHSGARKRIYELAEDPERLWIEFTDGMENQSTAQPDNATSLAGRAQAIISAYFFARLSDPITWTMIGNAPALLPFRADWLDRRWNHLIFIHVLKEHGAPTHYLRLVNESGQTMDAQQGANGASSPFMEVLAAKSVVTEPCTFFGKQVYFYNARASKSVRPKVDKQQSPSSHLEKLFRRRLIPLKIFFHLGLPPGSSLVNRLSQDPVLAIQLGLQKVPRQGQLLERPVLEFWTKDESVPRPLNVQEALLISELTAGQFEEMVETSYAVALALYVFLAENGLDLWAGSLEYAVTDDGMMLVDSIGPDELFISYDTVPITGTGTHQIYLQDTTQASGVDSGSQLQESLANLIAGESLFPEAPPLSRLIEQNR